MKVALYIEDGLEQIVLTPETETEKGIIGKMHDGTRSLDIHRGAFYGCRGGWIRFPADRYGPYSGGMNDDDSTMIVLRRKSEPEATI